MKVLLNKVELLNNDQAVGKLVVEDIDKDDTLQEMYRVLGCDCVDVRSFEVDGHLYDVWFDDEFMLKDGPKFPTVLLTANEGWSSEVLICGSVMFAKADMNGNTVGLDSADLKRVKKFAQKSAVKAVGYAMALIGR